MAVTDGEVLEVSRVDRYDPDGAQGPDNGGLSVSLLGDDGVRYYGSHLSALAAGISRGVRVRAGQRLGAVGRTGNANNVCHLHFGLSPPCAGTGDWWIRRGVIWPAPYLRAWRRARPARRPPPSPGPLQQASRLSGGQRPSRAQGPAERPPAAQLEPHPSPAASGPAEPTPQPPQPRDNNGDGRDHDGDRRTPTNARPDRHANPGSPRTRTSAAPRAARTPAASRRVATARVS